MAYDGALAERVREALTGNSGVVERKMFGGLAFLIEGNMCCGIVGQDLMVRVGPDAYTEALDHPHAREMDFTGRPLTGFVFVEPGGLVSDSDFRAWVEQGVRFARSLPPK